MTTGIIVQNGNMNYYITSYFHFLLFIKLYKGKKELFLQQILNNKFIHMVIGGHSGLGYIFENIVLAALIINDVALNKYLGVKQIRNVEKLDFKLDDNVELVTNVLYHNLQLKKLMGSKVELLIPILCCIPILSHLFYTVIYIQ